MKYRSHRGSLEDSMATVIEVNSLDDLRDKLNAKQEYEPFKIKGKLTCIWYCKDDRIGWDTYIVCADGWVIGMSNGKLEDI
jgi:hypothetical protein